MKRSLKLIAGVTLLEIMLVLAIAAMIIVMSIRYYQSATTNQQSNTVLEAVQAITTAADTLAQATGQYTGNVSTATISNIVPANSMNTPWGTAITIGAVTATSYTVTLAATPSAVCRLLTARLIANNHYGSVTACSSSTADLTYTYTSNP
jgi:Tfp pilus assembly protein PilE